MTNFQSYIKFIHDALNNTLVTGLATDTQKGMEMWCQLTGEIKATGNTMYLIGNGASAAMASHMACDASKNGGFRAQAFNDAALMTAVSNDLSYEQSFAMPLERFADPGDLLVTISSSGNSPNVIAAIKKARELDMKVVTLSGMKPENQSRELGDLNFYVPSPTYGAAETSHQILLHYWLDLFMDDLPIELEETSS